MVNSDSDVATLNVIAPIPLAALVNSPKKKKKKKDTSVLKHPNNTANIQKEKKRKKQRPMHKTKTTLFNTTGTLLDCISLADNEQTT